MGCGRGGGGGTSLREAGRFPEDGSETGSAFGITRKEGLGERKGAALGRGRSWAAVQGQ